MARDNARMEFAEVVRRRRMVRNFAPDAVDPAAVDRMLDHAVRAPSAGFTQGWAFLRLDTPDDVDRFWRATSPDPEADNAWLRGMRRAPVLIVPLCSRDAYLDRYAQPDKGWTDRDPDRWPVPYWYVDTGMATLLALLTAVDERLGACFFGIPTSGQERFRTDFAIPDDHAPLGVIAVGHPAPGGSAGSPRRRPRRTDVVHRGRWGG